MPGILDTTCDPRAGASRPEQIPELTSIRGFAATWVVLFHFNKDILALFAEPAGIRRVLESGYLGVDLFFVLSGFVISYNYADQFRTFRTRRYKAFLLARLARIYPVHLVTLIAVLPMVAVARRQHMPLDWQSYTLEQFIQNVFLIHAWIPSFKWNWNYPSWSISVEWLLYLLFPAFALLVARIRTPRTAIIATLLAVLLSVVTIRTTSEASFRELYRGFTQFSSGCLLFRLSRLLPSSTTRWRSAILWALCIGSVIAVQVPTIGPSLFVLTAPLIIASLVILRGRDRILCSAPLLMAGEMSFSLYMTHTLVQRFVNRAIPAARFADLDPLGRVGILLLYASLVAVAAILCFLLVEKPSRLALRRRMARAPRDSRLDGAAAMF